MSDAIRAGRGLYNELSELRRRPPGARRSSRLAAALFSSAEPVVPTLHVVQGPDKGRSFKTDDKVVLLGRGSHQVPLTDQTISRKHAELRGDERGWLLEDLKSANGTYVNGVRVLKPVRLKHGDQIRVGSTLLLYERDETVEEISGRSIPRDLVALESGAAQVEQSVAGIGTSEDSIVLGTTDTLYAVKSWKAMRELTAIIGSPVSTEQLLPRVLDIVFEQVPVDRGVIFVRDEETGELLPEVVRFHSRKSRAEAARNSIVTSRTIIDHVVQTHEGVLSTNAISDERFLSGKSIADLGMRSVICAPIVSRDQILGVIHLDVPVARHTYNEHELRLVTALGYQTGLAIENARLVQSLVERERLAATGQTVAYLSHSIKNILQGMRSGADLVQRGLKNADMNQTNQGWRILDRNLDRCYELMLNMLAFSKPREPNLEPYMINQIIEEVLDLVRGQAAEAHVRLETELDQAIPPIPIDREGFHQVILNLVSNALDAVPRGEGLIRVTTSLDSDERRVTIRVVDNGPGIPPDLREKVFEPFYSTKGHSGTGLGLAVARKVVTELGGVLRLYGPEGGGAEFQILLPTAEGRRTPTGDTLGPKTSHPQ